MRKGLMTAVMALALCGAFFVAQTQVIAGTGGTPGPVKINHETKKGPVAFDHAKHAAYACNKCHHKGDQKACFECHTAAGSETMPNNKKAMHGNCTKCHKKEAKGPTKCGECHK